MEFTRRDLMKTTAGLAAGAVGGSLLGQSAFAQEGPKYQIEQGATLRLLRWSPFVKGDEDQWLANTQRFTEATGQGKTVFDIAPEIPGAHAYQSIAQEIVHAAK